MISNYRSLDFLNTVGTPLYLLSSLIYFIFISGQLIYRHLHHDLSQSIGLVLNMPMSYIWLSSTVDSIGSRKEEDLDSTNNGSVGFIKLKLILTQCD
jgi:hypothetical protein